MDKLAILKALILRGREAELDDIELRIYLLLLANCDPKGFGVIPVNTVLGAFERRISEQSMFSACKRLTALNLALFERFDAGGGNCPNLEYCIVF